MGNNPINKIRECDAIRKWGLEKREHEEKPKMTGVPTGSDPVLKSNQNLQKICFGNAELT